MLLFAQPKKRHGAWAQALYSVCPIAIQVITQIPIALFQQVF
jgi:hypothetical protein